MSILLIVLAVFISILMLFIYPGTRLDPQALRIIDETLDEESPELVTGKPGLFYQMVQKSGMS